jgi:hypothetical protein
LFYIDHYNIWLDTKLLLWTGLQLFSRRRALGALSAELQRLNASPELVQVALRQHELTPSQPP